MNYLALAPRELMVISRASLLGTARAIRRVALQSKAPVYVFMDTPISVKVAPTWLDDAGALLGIYTETAAVRWIEADLYEHARMCGGANFIP